MSLAHDSGGPSLASSSRSSYVLIEDAVSEGFEPVGQAHEMPTGSLTLPTFDAGSDAIQSPPQPLALPRICPPPPPPPRAPATSACTLSEWGCPAQGGPLLWDFPPAQEKQPSPPPPACHPSPSLPPERPPPPSPFDYLALPAAETSPQPPRPFAGSEPEPGAARGDAPQPPDSFGLGGRLQLVRLGSAGGAGGAVYRLSADGAGTLGGSTLGFLGSGGRHHSSPPASDEHALPAVARKSSSATPPSPTMTILFWVMIVSLVLGASMALQDAVHAGSRHSAHGGTAGGMRLWAPAHFPSPRAALRNSSGKGATLGTREGALPRAHGSQAAQGAAAPSSSSRAAAAAFPVIMEAASGLGVPNSGAAAAFAHSSSAARSFGPGSIPLIYRLRELSEGRLGAGAVRARRHPHRASPARMR